MPSTDLTDGTDLTATQAFPRTGSIIAQPWGNSVFFLKEYNTMFMHVKLYWVVSVSVPPELAPDVDGICLMFSSVL